MNEALLNSIVEQVDAHERKIDEHLQQAQQYLMGTNAMHLSKRKSINESMHTTTFLSCKRCTATIKITGNKSALLRQPKQQEVVHHHHHASEIMWATAALFLIVFLLAAG